jgi:hemoglobin-like flavoprotein
MNLAVDHKVHIRTTFRVLVQHAPEFVDRFYQKFFELDPSARALFHGSMRLQGEKVMEILTTMVASLDLPTVVTPAVSALGRRHTHYGVRKEQFATLGTAFLWAIEQQLGAACTPDVRAAWAVLYQNIADMAVHAGYE